MKESTPMVAFFVFIFALVFFLQWADKQGENDIPVTVTLEGHEYYRSRSYGVNHSLCHKGNCKACEVKP